MHDENLHSFTHHITQWGYTSSLSYPDPFNAIELDVLITSPSKNVWKLPAFWRGGQRWEVRFIPEEEGLYTLETICSDTSNTSLHLLKHTLRVALQKETFTPLPKSLCISHTKRFLQDETGKAFFWLGDTWWMGLSKRLSYPKDFHQLTQDRKAKGFSVIQLVIGLFPDMNDFDERSKNEGGMAWETNYSCINPSYFDAADKRIAYLVQNNLIPCILGAWGYYFHTLGEEKMKKHWRYIIARWGVYPVVWCIAGEGAMPHYLSNNGPKDKEKQIQGWSAIGEYIKSIDPFHRLLTIHPTEIGKEQVLNPSLLNINMLQAGHNGYESVSHAVRLVYNEKNKKPLMPLIMSEVNYEGIMHDTSAEVQRLTFWSAILSGATGFSYGANGIWQVNTKTTPFGASPHGGTWGNTPWNEACDYLGAKQLGLAKKLLERFSWWLLEPHPEWLSPQQDLFDAKTPRIAGIPRQLRILYFYGPIQPWSKTKYKLENIEKDVVYEAFFWDPRTGKEYQVGSVVPNQHGQWQIPILPTFEDWILILKSTSPSLETKHPNSSKGRLGRLIQYVMSHRN